MNFALFLPANAVQIDFVYLKEKKEEVTGDTTNKCSLGGSKTVHVYSIIGNRTLSINIFTLILQLSISYGKLQRYRVDGNNVTLHDEEAHEDVGVCVVSIYYLYLNSLNNESSTIKM